MRTCALVRVCVHVRALPSVYEQDCVIAWQCVSMADLVTVTPSTLPSLHVLYWRHRENYYYFYLIEQNSRLKVSDSDTETRPNSLKSDRTQMIEIIRPIMKNFWDDPQTRELIEC